MGRTGGGFLKLAFGFFLEDSRSSAMSWLLLLQSSYVMSSTVCIG